MTSEEREHFDFEPHPFERVRGGAASLWEADREWKRRRQAERFEALPLRPLEELTGPFGLLYADPPWEYETNSTDPTRRIENHYPTMTLPEIRALPVREIAAKEGVLFLWSPSAKVAEALGVLEAWGYSYRTCLVWVKDRIGMGYYARQQHELLLLGVRGDLSVPLPERRPPSVLHAPREKHSRKPVEFYEVIERMYPELSKVELFSRGERRPGWAVWGNEAAPLP